MQRTEAPPRRPIPVRVRVTDGKGFEKNVALEADLLRVGRDPGNDLRLDHPDVAPCHFLILREGARYLLADTSGGHGTRLNGTPVVKQQLEHGDEISLGPGCPYRIVFLTEGVRADDREERYLRALLDASRAISSSLVLDDVLERVMDSVMELTGARRGFLILVEPGGALKPRVARNADPEAPDQEVEPASRGIIEETIAARRSLFIGAGRGPAGGSPGAAPLGPGPRTVLCVPILLHGRVLGVIYVDHRDPQGRLCAGDLEILESLADHASVAIDNARLTERMLLAERLAALGRMFSSIMHDLAGPLTSIRAAALLLQGDAGGSKTPRLTGMILDAVDRMHDMTREVLDYCRGRMALSILPRRLSALLEQVLDAVRDEMAKRSIRVVLDARADATVLLDAHRMERVLRNLFGNAADAMPRGGVLTVRTARQDDGLSISVTDTGRGMTEEVRRRVFEPFFTDGKPDGTGLGMAIARRILEAHGGRIEVDSAPSAGTTVRLVLPAERIVAAQAARAAPD